MSEHQIDIGDEELVNALTHGFGLLLSVTGAITLIAVSIFHGTTWQIVGCTIAFFHPEREVRERRRRSIPIVLMLFLLTANNK
jgi:hypothetical protein